MNPDSTPSINTHIILGRVKNEPVLRFTQSGTAKLAFMLRTDRPQPDGRIFSDNHKVVAWGRQAEGFGRDLREGDVVSVTGRLGSRKWEKNDGSPRQPSKRWPSTALTLPSLRCMSLHRHRQHRLCLKQTKRSRFSQPKTRTPR